MTRVFDDPSTFTAQALDGFAALHADYVTPVEGGVVRATASGAADVAVVIGGGTGHYPAFAGLVGPGLATGAVCGNIFTSPSGRQAYAVARAASSGGGVLFSFGNYAGDVLHFAEASHRLAAEGIDVRTVLVTDDIASAPLSERHRRRGIAGDFTVFKVAGAGAERGLSLDEVERLARSANERTRTLGVAFGGCTLPGDDHPLFSVPAGQMSIGLGIHGEPAIRDVPVPSAADLARLLVDRLLEDVPDDRGDRVAVIVNGLGTVKYEELFLLYGHLARLLSDEGITIVGPECGELVTSLDMAGLSVTLFWLDDELEQLWLDPADSPAFRRGAVRDLAPRRLRSVPGAAPDDAVVHESTAASRKWAVLAGRLLGIAADVVVQHVDDLGRIDAFAGDGDHGTGMRRGLEAATAAARSALDEQRGLTDTLVSAGTAWSDIAGGTSGALWGAALAALGSALGEREEYSAADVSAAVSAAVSAVQELGGAGLGDKTMVDAMVPYARALEAEVSDGSAMATALTEAARRATTAARDTSDLTPRLGRARPLAERSIGHPDAGATSFALIVTALAEAIAQSQDPTAEQETP